MNENGNLYTCSYISPLGEIMLVGSEQALTGLYFGGQKYYPKELKTDSIRETLPIFLQTARWLDNYFSGKEPDFTPNIVMKGTPFQMAVWDILRTIPYGQTMTYGQIAAKLAQQTGIKKMSAQAVGGAVGRNPISIIVPCHRVVGADGSLTGYAGGIDRKRGLLRLENSLQFPVSMLH